MSFFVVENIGIRFGGVVAVGGVSFSVNRGEVYTIIGPNGAGKTTIFNLIGLIYPPTTGRILFEGEEVKGAPHNVNTSETLLADNGTLHEPVLGLFDEIFLGHFRVPIPQIP